MTAAPWDLNEAIAAATAILGMLELPKEDVPPEHIWHHDELLEDWFAAVEQRRKDKFKGLETVPDATDDENTVVNELAAGLRD